MNSLVDNGHVTVLSCGINFSYTVNDNGMFLPTEYKVLQSQAGGCFIKCMKMLFNGKIQFYYLTSGYKSLAALLPSLDAEGFLTICASLLADIVEVKNIGFLSCQSIDISPEHIYIDPATYKVSLIYIPVARRMFEDVSSFESELRTSLVKMIQDDEKLSSSKTMQFRVNLSNGMMTMEELYKTIKAGAKAPCQEASRLTRKESGEKKGFGTSHMKIVALNAPMKVEIDITKSEFFLGRKLAVVDGVISFNNMIGRCHCKINQNGGKYTVTDLQSANGTYINQAKLQPNQPYPIKNGDILRLANSDFQVIV